ncbi:hypothetical protein G5C51_41605 [Streptomyces sp. A7024]|uniref:Uncharacterized protein n=1 Tax=Streptomyces coryli TaxID=1128680 RepID=A0A6G4UEZ9_9ACTN|nr:hypothetical protein [Streptomyces coryli]NGN70367.1 hypothetical protein [Streptomyces coryli]
MPREPTDDDLRRALEFADRTPLPEPAYSDDLTEDDVAPLRDFLRARLGELKARQPEGGEEHFAVHALSNAMLSTAMRLTDEVNAWRVVAFSGRSEEPGLVQTLREQLGLDFNLLVWVARRWRDHPDYDPRWQPRRYLNPDHRASLETPTGGDTSVDAVRGPYGREAHP